MNYTGYSRDDFSRTFTSLNELYRQAKPAVVEYAKTKGCDIRWVVEGSPEDVEKQIDCYIFYPDGTEHSMQIKALNAKWSGLNTITMEHIEHTRGGVETTHNYRKCLAEFYMTIYFNPAEHKVAKLVVMKTPLLIKAVDSLNEKETYTVPKKNVCSSGKLIIIPLRKLYEYDPRIVTKWCYGEWNLVDPIPQFK